MARLNDGHSSAVAGRNWWAMSVTGAVYREPGTSCDRSSVPCTGDGVAHRTAVRRAVPRQDDVGVQPREVVQGGDGLLRGVGEELRQEPGTAAGRGRVAGDQRVAGQHD